jgi:hypothetical protein
MKRAIIIGMVFILTLVIAMAQTLPEKSKNESNRQQEKTPPRATINPYSVDFKDQVVKKASKPQRITVTNSGEKPLYINSAVLEGENKDDFSMANDTCTGATIAPGKSCVIDASMTPAATGYRKATITLTNNSVESPQKIELTGNGINSARVPPTGPDN